MQIRLPDPIVALDGIIEISLTRMEGELLKLLIANQGKVMTHVEIAVKLWGETDRFTAAGMTRPLCAKLRRKIGQERIATVHSRGYIYL